jgi:hypothetical protein
MTEILPVRDKTLVSPVPLDAAARRPARAAHALLVLLLGLALAATATGPAAAAGTRTTTVAGTSMGVAVAAVAADDALYQPVEPRRVLDFVPLGTGATHTLKLTGVPAGATAVALNVTATRVSAPTFVSACAGGLSADACRQTSAFNPEPGQDTPSAVLVALGGAAHDEVTFYNNAGTLTLIADLHGFYAPAEGSTFQAAGPRRVLAFRPVGPREAITLTIPDVPTGATAVALNLTHTATTEPSYVAACPADQPLTTCTQSSVLNPFPGRDAGNHTIVKLGGPHHDQVTLYNNAGTTHLIADVQGFFTTTTTGARLRTTTPTRVLAFHPIAGPATWPRPGPRGRTTRSRPRRRSTWW